jgi:hypothetical protein
MKNLRKFVKLRTAVAFDKWKELNPSALQSYTGEQCAEFLENLLDKLDKSGEIPISCDKCNGTGDEFEADNPSLGTWEIVCKKCGGNGYVIPNVK